VWLEVEEKFNLLLILDQIFLTLILYDLRPI
jgi:hypothetical protein